MTFALVRRSDWPCGRLEVFLCGTRRPVEQHIGDGCRLSNKRTARRRDMISLFEPGNQKSEVRSSSYRLIKTCWKSLQANHLANLSCIIVASIRTSFELEDSNSNPKQHGTWRQMSEIVSREARPALGTHPFQGKSPTGNQRHCFWVWNNVATITKSSTRL